MKLQRADAMNQRIHTLADVVGRLLVDGFHYLALFAIGGVIVWSAAVAFLAMTETVWGAILLLALAALVIRYGSFKFPSGQAAPEDKVRDASHPDPAFERTAAAQRER